MNVAVLGAGFQGTCVALELARRGVGVHLIDANDAPVTQAGLVNEGKIHLGYTYANDASLRTARLMIRGALRFQALLGRWTSADPDTLGLSEPHLYAVLRDSILPVERMRDHYAGVRGLLREAEAGEYLGIATDFPHEELSPSEAGRLFDRDRVLAVYRTVERSVDSRRIADALRRAVSACDAIRFLPRTRVLGVQPDGSGFRVLTSGDPLPRFDQVVNALWGGRLAVDAGLQLHPAAAWLYRFKHGILVDDLDPQGQLPSATFAIGRFGDIVRYPDGGVYLCWYPDCLGGMSSELAPPEWPREPDEETARVMVDRSWRALAALCRPLEALGPPHPARTRVMGGVIFAYGTSDVDDVHSGLHCRSEVGVHSTGGYHSIDTGKYTLAPLFAMEAAARVCGDRQAAVCP